MIKRKIFVNLLVITMAIACTSCINIVEKVFFKKSGGGTYSMTLDMSQIASMMSAFADDEDSEMALAFKEMNKEFEASKEKLERVRGVRNVRQEMNTESLILTLLFDFENVDALNRGMSQYYHDEADGAVKQYTFFTQDKKTTTRTNKDIIGESLKKELSSDDEEMDLSVILSDMYHETVLEFERDIKSVSNENYSQDGNRRISWKKYLFNKRDADQPLEVKVTTK